MFFWSLDVFFIFLSKKSYYPLNDESNNPKIFKKVDFPEPEGPTIETISPWYNLKDISFNITTLLLFEVYSFDKL